MLGEERSGSKRKGREGKVRKGIGASSSKDHCRLDHRSLDEMKTKYKT